MKWPNPISTEKNRDVLDGGGDGGDGSPADADTGADAPSPAVLLRAAVANHRLGARA